MSRTNRAFTTPRAQQPRAHNLARGLQFLCLGWLALATTSAALAQGRPLPQDPLELRCWQKYTRERTRVDLRDPTAVQFSNLRDGQVLRTPFAVEFGVRGMGVAPAGLALPGTGHHHILVNRALPTQIGEKLPFDDSHRHFGKGQTHTLLNLPAGRHTLRLLFADHEHRPYFVYSREIAVQVRGPRDATPAPRINAANFDATCAAWYDDETASPRPAGPALYVANIRADEALSSPFNVRLAVDGFGICATNDKPPGTGHFVLEVLDAATGRRALPVADLRNGSTQVNVNVGPGRYTLRLRLVGGDGRDLTPMQEMPVRVVAQETL